MINGHHTYNGATTINGGVLSIAFTHDGRIVSCGRDHQVKLWGPDGAQLKSFEAFNDIALRAAFIYVEVALGVLPVCP